MWSEVLRQVVGWGGRRTDGQWLQPSGYLPEAGRWVLLLLGEALCGFPLALMLTLDSQGS